jgi:transposase-like protein
MDAPFPCPFCHSPAVVAAGGSRSFVHYRCETCAEVWTAQRAPLPAPTVVVSKPAVPKSN